MEKQSPQKNPSNKELSQKEIWDIIAPEWYEFRKEPKENVLNFLKKQKGKILDMGSGSGRYLTKIKNGEMYLVDFSDEMIKLAKKKADEKKIKAKFKVADITKLPYPNNFFDSAICVAVVHCISDENQRNKAIKELFRVLKPGAKAKISVWNKKTRRFKNSPKDKFMKWRDTVTRYYYLYEEKEVINLFKAAGFKIIEKEKDNNIIFVVEKP